MDDTGLIDNDIQPIVTGPNINLSDEEDDTDQLLRRIVIEDTIAEFIVMDLQFPEIVEGCGFKRIMTNIGIPPFDIPNKNELEEKIIPRMYDSTRKSVINSLSCMAMELTLSFDEWKSNNDINFVTVSIHYLNGETLERKILSTFYAPRNWEESHWGSTIDALLLEWDLKIERITAVVVSTSRKELLTTLKNRGLILVPCLLHTLQVCAQACFNKPEVATILSKCRSLIKPIISHPAAATVLIIQEQLSKLKKNAMLLDYPDVWISTYNMLKQMVQNRNVITFILENLKELDLDMFEITNEQWKVMNDLVDVLEPFIVIIMILSKEKIFPISLLMPLLYQLVSVNFKVKESDSDTVKTFKESLSDMLRTRYAGEDVTLILQIATTLDPRFKTYVSKEEYKNILVNASIKEMLTKIIERERLEILKTDNETEETVQNEKLGSGMESFLPPPPKIKVMSAEEIAEEIADIEILQYQFEDLAPFLECPLQWWSKVSVKCPFLAKLAKRYCVPACCAPLTRIPADIQIQYARKRATIPDHLIDKVLFLHDNH